MLIYAYMDLGVYVPCTRYAHLNLFHLIRTRLQESIQPWGKWITFIVIVILLYSQSLIWNWTNDGVQVWNLPFSGWLHMKNFRRVYQLYPGNTFQLDLGEWDFCCPKKNPLSHHTALETKNCRYRRCHHFLGWGRMDDCPRFTEVTAVCCFGNAVIRPKAEVQMHPGLMRNLQVQIILATDITFLGTIAFFNRSRHCSELSFWLPSTSNKQMTEVAANYCRLDGMNPSAASFMTVGMVLPCQMQQTARKSNVAVHVILLYFSHYQNDVRNKASLNWLDQKWQYIYHNYTWPWIFYDIPSTSGFFSSPCQSFPWSLAPPWLSQHGAFAAACSDRTGAASHRARACQKQVPWREDHGGSTGNTGGFSFCKTPASN